jgi:hypothetical protein
MLEQGTLLDAQPTFQAERNTFLMNMIPAPLAFFLAVFLVLFFFVSCFTLEPAAAANISRRDHNFESFPTSRLSI